MWSKYNYPKSLCKSRPSLSPPSFIGQQVKESEIVSGITGCAKQLVSAVSWIEILFGVSAMNSRQSGWFSKDPSEGGSR